MTLPGSKSIALRQLAISSLKPGTTTLHGMPDSADITAMKSCLRALGVEISDDEPCVVRTEELNLSQDLTLDPNMSGVSLRLLLAIAALRTGSTHFAGHPSLQARPNGDLLNALKQLGCNVESNDGRLPITVTGPVLRNQVRLRVSTSSQYLTALLIVAPCLREGITVELEGDVVSKPYVDLTIHEMQKRGIEVWESTNAYCVSPNEYAEQSIHIEGDASSATYFAALATLHGSRIRFPNLGSNSKQGDIGFLDVCEQLGATVHRKPNEVEVIGPSSLSNIDDIDMREMPDAAPTLMAIAPYLDRPTRITGLSTLRDKECDRVACPTVELRAAGVGVDEGSDFMVIHPKPPKRHTFSTYDDHRMAMSFALFATKTPGCRINDPDCVSKTYPNFWEDVAKLY